MLINDPAFGKCVKLESHGIAAVIAPAMGMSLVSFTVEGEEILDQSRKDIFLKSRKGLGPLILPRFNQQGPCPSVDVSSFPHVKALKELGIKHPFQHGVGRYAAWDYSAGEYEIAGRLKGGDQMRGFSLAELNGFDFSAEVTYRLSGKGLEIALILAGEQPVQAGIHFYYALKNRASARALMPVEGGKNEFRFNQAYDLPLKPEKRMGGEVHYRLETDTYALTTAIRMDGAPETVFEDVIIFSPADASFVCIEPLSCLEVGKSNRTKFNGIITLMPERAG